MTNATAYPAIFTYEKGVVMTPTVKAPARRVGWFANALAPRHLNDNGWKLFDQAVAWTTGS